MKKHLLLAITAVLAASGLQTAVAQQQTLTSANGTVSSNTLWTSTTTPKTTITLNGGNFLTESAYGDNIAINTAGATRTVTIAPSFDWCYVAGYSMTVTGYLGDGVIINAGDQTLTTDATEKTLTVSGLTPDTPASFTITPSESGHAKKLLIKNVTITYALKNASVTYERLSKSGWSISACCEETSGEGANNGFISKLIDDNASTFWHSQWSPELHNCPHYFVIDLGESKEFARLELINRGAAGNGAAIDTDIYVSNTPFDNVTQSNAGSYGTPTKSVTLSGNMLATEVIDLDEQNARYLMVVIKSSRGTSDANNNKFACAAEVNLYSKHIITMVEAANQEIQATSNEKISSKYFGYKGLFSAAEQAEISSDFTLTELTGIADVQNAVQAIDVIANSTIPERLNGRVIYVLNKRRQQTSSSFTPAYLTITDGGINTISYPSELGKWLLVRDGQTANFSLYSLERNSYLAMENGVATLTSDASASQKFYFDANPYISGFGAAMHFVNSGNGFNLDTNNSALTQYGYADGGSSWVFELAGAMAENLVDGKYYRIRCNRAMYGNNGSLKTSGSLLGINTVIEDGATENESQQVISKHDGFGTVWQLKAVEGGKYQLLNAAADFSGNEQLFAIGKQSDESRNAYAASTNAANFVIFNATDRNYGYYAGHIPYTIALATPDITGGNGSCMDYNGSAYVLSEWNPGNDEYNNGSTYYFEPLADTEVAAMKEAYMAAAVGVDFSAFDSALSTYAGYEALFGDSFAEFNQTIEQLKSDLEGENLAEVTDIKTANSAIATNRAIADSYNPRLAEAIAAVEARLPEIYASADGRQVQISNFRYTDKQLTSDGTNLTSSDAGSLNLNSVWTLEHTDGAKYKLYNYGHNSYTGNQNNIQSAIPMVEAAQAQEYTLVLHGNGYFSMNSGSGSYPLLHEAAEHNIVKWTTGDASNWSASAVDTNEMYEVTDPEAKVDFSGIVSEEVIHNLCFESKAGHTLALSEGLGSHHVLLIERFDPADFAGQPAVAALAADNSETATPQPTATYSFTKDNLVADSSTENHLEFADPDQAIEAGVLRITAPMGFFTVDGKLSAPFTVHYTLAENGTTTGVNEVNVTDEEAEVMWYTVQGVRVAQPASTGVYIRVAAGKASKVFVTK